MPIRTIELTDRHDALVEALVQSGEYTSASDVLGDSLRLLTQRKAEDAARLKALREAVAIGIADMESGNYVEFDSPEALTAYMNEVAESAMAAAEER